MNVYEKSNSIETVKLKSFTSAQYNNVLNSNETVSQRQKNAQELINYLCDKFNIERVPVKVVSKSQPHSTQNGKLRSKTLGTYSYGSNVYITMYNLTAVKKKEVAIKTFTNTLLHEFMHHYDFHVLKFNDSLHTAGFYKRISDLASKLS